MDVAHHRHPVGQVAGVGHRHHEQSPSDEIGGHAIEIERSGWLGYDQQVQRVDGSPWRRGARLVELFAQ